MDKEFLKRLLSTNSPDGRENLEAIDIFNFYCEKFAKFEFTDSMNNSAFSIGNGKIPFMISAHIDEISMLVQYIDEDGFIYVIPSGGIDKEVLLGSRVIVVNNEGFVTEGIVSRKPMHLNKGEKKELKMSDIKIDCGFESKEEAMSIVHIGDSVMMKSDPTEMGANRLTSKGLDDKVGVFVVCEVMKKLSHHNFKSLKLFGVAMTQEETGGSGAIMASKHINPEYSIDFDVHFATDDGNVDPREWGDVKLGKGGAIAYSPDCNLELNSKIRNICVDNEIPFQEFAKPNGMTNTLKIKNSSYNAKTALLSIPLRNMHTPVEICDFRDLDSIIKMTVETILFYDEFLSVEK